MRFPYTLIRVSLIALCCVSLAVISVFGQEKTDAQALFAKGNQLYKESKYDEAIQEYEQVLSKGYVSGNLYFNLGNSYFKIGKPGKAVLNYERAKQLIPQDSDLRSNYDYTLSLLSNPQEPFPGNRFTAALDKITDGLSINSIVMILSLFYLCLLFVLLLSFFFGFMRKKIAIVAGACVLLFLIGLFSLSRKAAFIERGAVVTSVEAQVRFEPQEEATAYFKVYEGSKVEVIEKSGSWYKIRRNIDLRGWLPEQVVERI